MNVRDEREEQLVFVPFCKRNSRFGDVICRERDGGGGGGEGGEKNETIFSLSKLL